MLQDIEKILNDVKKGTCVIEFKNYPQSFIDYLGEHHVPLLISINKKEDKYFYLEFVDRVGRLMLIGYSVAPNYLVPVVNGASLIYETINQNKETNQIDLENNIKATCEEQNIVFIDETGNTFTITKKELKDVYMKFIY